MNLSQIFDESDFRRERGLSEDKDGFLGGNFLGHMHGSDANATLEGITTFGPSVSADVEPFGIVNKQLLPADYAPGFLAYGEKQYVAGRIVGNGKAMYLEAGSEALPPDFALVITPIALPPSANIQDLLLSPDTAVEPKLGRSRFLGPGQKLMLFDLEAIDELIEPDRVYVVQFGSPVRHHPSLDGFVGKFPRVDGLVPRYSLLIERNILYPKIKLIGIIPEGDAAQVITAEVYVSQVPDDGPDEGLVARVNARPVFTVEYACEHKPESPETILNAAKVSEAASKHVTVKAIIGQQGQMPEELIRHYISSQLLPEIAAKTGSIADGTPSYSIDLSLNRAGI
ncbi:TPA: hypothetical protein HA231_01360 [Candidatus Woesearchaeota archaeon]|nr:hypothetical protein [Candidatus Woesearchaeota archaeon]